MNPKTKVGRTGAAVRGISTVLRGMALAALLGLAGTVAANNISVTNFALKNTDIGAGTTDVQFDLRWENSWRASWDEVGVAGSITNWDAAWVFIKFRVLGGAVTNWRHAWLSPDGHSVPAGAAYSLGTNGGATNVGAFIYRSGEGHGDINLSRVSLRWNYGTNGVTKNDPLDICVHAIEMVYIPQGSFWVGTGGSVVWVGPDWCSFTDGARISDATIPFRITNEAALTIAQSAGNLWAKDYSGHPGISGGTLAAAFPKGYGAFYCMKYEITQGQYTDFLNTLTGTQASNHFSATSTGYRYTIGTNAAGIFTNAAPDRACNFIYWTNAVAYADWAGLRPMTELEFEKACRGPKPPVPNEYAWGNTMASNTTNFVGADGSGIEMAMPSTANALYSDGLGIAGPVRVGLFATSNSLRSASGASYFGVLDMSGNVYEQVVAVPTPVIPDGSSFTGLPGDGSLDTNGYANVIGWPTLNGSLGRGGSYNYSIDRMTVSDRFYASNQNHWHDNNLTSCGWRGVRQAP